MLECTFISKIFAFLNSAAQTILVVGILGFSVPVFAQVQSPAIPPAPPKPQAIQDPNSKVGIPSGNGAKNPEETGLFEPTSPYLDYGDFNLSDDEDQETLYYQYGRFFGVAVGVGYEAATGDRGNLWNAAFPRVDLKVQYWFDFQVALSFGIFFASHSFVDANKAYTDSLIGFGAELKYYFDVRNMSAAFTFANPYIFGGLGAIGKTETTPSQGSADTDSTFSVSVGFGFEFPIVFKSTYFSLEGRYFTQSFGDTNTDQFKDRVPDLSGGFYNISGNILFVW